MTEVPVANTGGRVPLDERLFLGTLSDLKQVKLRGTKCLACGEVFFGKYVACENCGSANMKEVALGDALEIVLAANQLAYEIKGTAQIIKEWCESFRFPQMMIELRVDSVRENMYPANFVIGDVPVGWPESTDAHHGAWNAAIAEEMRRGRHPEEG